MILPVRRSSVSLLWWMMLACILDRTGQSGSEQIRRELMDHRTRIQNLEHQFIQVEARVNQIEDLTQSRGQKDLLKMETLEELRTEIGRLRGEVEVVSHSVGTGAQDLQGRAEDAAYRLAWLESRADQLENALGLKPTSPPTVAPPPIDTPSTWDGQMVPDGEGATASTPEPRKPPRVVAVGDPVREPPLDPNKLIASAKTQMASENYPGAEAMLTRFLELYPNHARAGEATYRRAEASMKAKQYKQAILRFQSVIDQFKGSSWAPWAMLRQGECFEEQGQNDNAKVFFSEVVRLFPRSRAAATAKKKLGRR
jgi:tol-pal system protein YbgF